MITKTARKQAVSLNYRPDIDGLRAVAILSVLIFHAFPSRLPGGYIGVDVFFVISGYLISSIILRELQNGRFRFSVFYARRIRRIFPALLLLLPACGIAGWFLLLPAEYSQLGQHIAASAGFVQNLMLWSEAGYFDTASELKPLTHLWSLAIEEQFYLLFPLLVWLLWKLGLRLRGALLSIVLLVAVSFSLNVYIVRADATAAFFLPQFRVWEILAGSLLAYIQTRRSQKSASGAPAIACAWRHVESLAGAVCLLAALVFIRQHSHFPGWWAVLPVAGSFLLIQAGPHACINRWVLARAGMVFIGLISYPLYLWHWPLLVFARLVAGDIPPWEVRLGILILSIVLAWLTFRFVEIPLRSRPTTWLKTAILSTFMAVAGSLGLLVYVNKGLPQRLPQQARAILDYHYDYIADYREGSCFLRPEQDASAFGGCDDDPEALGTSAHSILLWGDSHAAHLYPGIRRRFGGAATIIQRTASGCPPIVGLQVADRGHCHDINTQILEEIRQKRPQIILLAAAWFRYDDIDVTPTVDALKAMGAGHIVLIGPAPRWQDGLPRRLQSWMSRHRTASRLPARLRTGYDAETLALDHAIAASALRNRVEYISLRDALCTEYGCLTQARQEGGSFMPTAWDYGHFTPAASDLAADALPLRLLEKKRDGRMPLNK